MPPVLTFPTSHQHLRAVSCCHFHRLHLLRSMAVVCVLGFTIHCLFHVVCGPLRPLFTVLCHLGCVSTPPPRILQSPQTVRASGGLCAAIGFHHMSQDYGVGSLLLPPVLIHSVCNGDVHLLEVSFFVPPNAHLHHSVSISAKTYQFQQSPRWCTTLVYLLAALHSGTECGSDSQQSCLKQTYESCPLTRMCTSLPPLKRARVFEGSGSKVIGKGIRADASLP